MRSAQRCIGRPVLYLLGSLVETTLFLYLLLVALQVLDHEILSGQLEVVPVVIDPLSRVQVEVVQNFVNGVALDPENVPVLTAHK